jgi:hypothetical protein
MGANEDFDKDDPFAEESTDELNDEPESEDEGDGFPGIEEDETPALVVWVNAGFGNRSYQCYIKSDSTMTIPDPLVRELDLHPGDDLDYEFDEQECVLYISKKVIPWEAPEWLQD